MRPDMRAGRGGRCRGDFRDPARIARRGVLRLLIDRVRIAGLHQRERTERIDLGERNLVRDAAQMGRDPVRDRRAETVAYLRVIDADGNASCGSISTAPNEQSAPVP